MNIEFKKSTSPEDLNTRVLAIQKKIEEGGSGESEARFELNKLAENADDFREEFEQENMNWNKLHIQQEINKETVNLQTTPENELSPKEKIEKRRHEELELMLKEKAIEINENNFDFELVGAPEIFDTTAYLKEKKIEDINFYQMFYDNNVSDKSFSLLVRNSGKVIYIYKRGNLISGSGRSGSFFGISIELNNIYCTDFEKLERFLDTIFEKLIIEKYKIVRPVTNKSSKYTHVFNIKNFKEIPKATMDELKNIIINNLRNAFAGDFRKEDENFKKKIKNYPISYNLHVITKFTKFISDKGKEKIVEGGVDHSLYEKDIEAAEIKETGIEDIKPFDSKYFDFDRNEINTKYDNKLAELEKAEKKD
jgi:hypothetical protein